MKTMTIAMSVLALSGIMSGMLAETADAKKVRATRGQVSQACKANGGSTYGFPRRSGGGYGCTTKGGWIDCQRNGHCEGGRFEDNTAARTTRKGGRR